MRETERGSSFMARVRVVSLVSLALLLGGLTLTSYLSQQWLFREIEQDQEKLAREERLLLWKVEVQLDRMEQQLLRLARLGEVKEAFSKRDRQELLEQALPPLNRLRKSSLRIEQVNFYLPSGTVFLRAHDPDAYGDDVAGLRPLIAKVAQARRIVRALEPEASAFFLWVAAPVYDAGRFLGILEMGTPLASFFEDVKAHLGAEVGLFVKSGPGSADVVPAEATDRRLIGHVAAALALPRGIAAPARHVVVADDRTYATSLIPLKELSAPEERAVALIFDVTPVARLLHRNTTSFNAISAIGFLLAAGAIFALTKRLKEAHLNLEARSAHLHALSQLVASSLDRQPVFEYIVRAATDLIAGSMASLWILGETTRELTQAATTGLRQPHLRTLTRIPLGVGLVGEVASTGRPLVAPDVQTDARFANREWARAEGVHAYAGVPLICEGRCLGVLSVLGRFTRRFTPGELEILASFAGQAATAIQKAQLYAEVKAYSETLEGRVQERTRELDEANRHKSQFLANMSHELRTPLNAIIGFSQLLEDPRFGALTEKQARYVANIHTSGKHLLTLVNEILDLSKVEAGKLELRFERVQLAGLLRDALAVIQDQAAKKQLHVILDLPSDLPEVLADPLRLKQVVYNLLSNAVKFTPEGERITLGARHVRSPEPAVSSPTAAPSGVSVRGSGRLPGTGAVAADAGSETGGPPAFIEIAVTDTGIGIKPEDMPKLFQQFTQLEPVYLKQYQGTGLGLALTKRLVELHGGTIRAESRGEGRGTTFTIRLPLARPGEPEA